MAASNQFKEILNAAKEKRGDLPVDTMIVSSHLSQMRMFILRRGIEFFSEQDSYGGRKAFLKKVYEHNMLEMKLAAGGEPSTRFPPEGLAETAETPKRTSKSHEPN